MTMITPIMRRTTVKPPWIDDMGNGPVHMTSVLVSLGITVTDTLISSILLLLSTISKRA
jgi:hypothetical protein